MGEAKPVVGLMTCHPHPSRQTSIKKSIAPCKHFIQSTAFKAQFAKQTEQGIFEAIRRYCGSQRGGFLGRSELILVDDNDIAHRFAFETFYNGYDALTLGVHLKLEPALIAVG